MELVINDALEQRIVLSFKRPQLHSKYWGLMKVLGPYPEPQSQQEMHNTPWLKKTQEDVADSNNPCLVLATAPTLSPTVTIAKVSIRFCLLVVGGGTALGSPPLSLPAPVSVHLPELPSNPIPPPETPPGRASSAS